MRYNYTNLIEHMRLKYKVRAIAAGMKWNFPLCEPSWSYTINDRWGNRIIFSNRNGNRMEISGCSVFSHYHTETIGVSRDRPTPAILNEIRRRIMPNLKQQYQKDRAYSEQRRAGRVAQFNAVTNLARCAGVKFRHGSGRAERGGEAFRLPAGKCEVMERELNISCYLQIDTSPQLAEIILKLLKQEEKQ